MTDILVRIMGILNRIRNMQELTMVTIILFAGIFAFGFLNCILGYRLLRFWIMLCGFVTGAAISVWVVHSMDMGMTSNYVYLGAGLAGGIVLSIFVFLIYKVGLFILGTGIGITLSVYILNPKESSVFFLCILAGIGVGMLGLRFAKGVIIIGTSFLGGIMAGFSLAKLGQLSEFPYGVALSAGFIALGLLVQFTINKTKEVEEEEEPKEIAPEWEEMEEELTNEYEELLAWEDEEAKNRRRRAKAASEIRADRELYEQMKKGRQNNGKRG